MNSHPLPLEPIRFKIIKEPLEPVEMAAEHIETNKHFEPLNRIKSKPEKNLQSLKLKQPWKLPELLISLKELELYE